MTWDWSAVSPKPVLNQTALPHNHLQPFMDSMYPNNDGLVPQEKTFCDRNQLAQKWIEAHSEDFQRIVWPLRLPEMSQVEHFWAMVEISIRT